MPDASRGFRDLLVWQKAMDVVVECYRLGDRFPKSEAYGLTSQLRRAACSVPLNIAEGRGRRRVKMYLHFLDIAYGSLMEVETCLEIAVRLGYIDEPTRNAVIERVAEVGRMLNGLIAAIERSAPPDGT